MFSPRALVRGNLARAKLAVENRISLLITISKFFDLFEENT